MSNGNEPAYPAYMSRIVPDSFLVERIELPGLTKRELFALRLSCALLSNASITGSVVDGAYMLNEGVDLADRLLGLLDGEKV